MTQMLILSQANTGLARAEVEALTNKPIKLHNYILLTDSNKNLEPRLAFTRFFYKFMFHCKEKDLIKKIKNFNWNKHYKYSFCIRKFGKTDLKEAELADLIWEKLENPNVKLSNPKTRFDFYFTKKGVFCGLFRSKARKDFKNRLTKLRPGLHPTTIKPRLAAAIINLTGIQKGVVYDPMCGTGGILIEAAVMNLNPVGSDIDERMLNLAEKNLNYYKLKARIFKKDALKIKKSYNYIVTDLPYSKNTRTQDLKKLYKEFLKNLKKILIKRAVIVFPNFIKHKALIKNANLKLIAEYEYYLHKSLSRTVCIIEL
ncbi:methyltransferase domain-containing protein [Candidatus Woesearchaeota archaeon]|nr:methyltransferase domain-containing protein [Candidatus Woesearchaeota archaeon]MBW2978514.1 methyltransferase domain-containing protein [Candidatus Woesearchaeota archaeon]